MTDIQKEKADFLSAHSAIYLFTIPIELGHVDQHGVCVLSIMRMPVFLNWKVSEYELSQ